MSIDGESGLEQARKFVFQHKLNHPNLIIDTGTVASLYQAETGEAFRATPTFMVFNPDGNLRATQAVGIPPETIERFVASNS